MTPREAARSDWPSIPAPRTRTRLASGTCTRGPSRRQARSAKARKALAAQLSGSLQTRLQPSPEPTRTTLSLSPGMSITLQGRRGELRGGPVRRQDALPEGKGTDRCQQPETNGKDIRY